MGDKVGDKLGDKVSENNGDIHLSATQRKILAQIRNDPNITKPQLATALGVGKTTIDNGISVLRKNGLLERIGSNRSGYWKVVERR
jgi:predicted HTH transcriptional regulator